MNYFKVKETSDQQTIYTNRNYPFTLIKGELFTEKELNKKGIQKESAFFEKIPLSPAHTRKMFGCRYALKSIN